MCPACIAIVGLVATVFRPWRARRTAERDAAAAAWRANATPDGAAEPSGSRWPGTGAAA